MHTLESTIIITTVTLCIFGCIFMEREIFERIMVHRQLCMKAEQMARLMKEPLCNKQNGFITRGDESKNIYHPIKTLLSGNSRDLSKNRSFENPFKLEFLKTQKGMFSEDRTAYQERMKARWFDPLEVIRITDQGIELMLELKRK